MSLEPPVLPMDGQLATKSLVEFLVDILWPKTLGLKNRMTVLKEKKNGDNKALAGTRGVFALCCSQIHKCVLHLIEIFQLEHRNNISLQESRDCITERLSWCFNKLHLVQKTIDTLSQNIVENNSSNSTSLFCDDNGDTLDNSLLTRTMYFVDWIDHSLEILNNLSTTVYRTDHKESTEVFDTWKNEVIDSVSGLHTSVDELLLAAMTLCRHCLPADQPIVTARCQVVLRETKCLISEIIEGDVNKGYKVSKDSLKQPLKPTNINVLIDVLKDALYILEANTNTALLSLLVHCFSAPVAPLDNLVEHLSNGACHCKGIEDVDECSFVKEFDFYNERLIQMGGFSISCSSDESRVLSLKSGLASLEALDPHLVPAVLLAPHSAHTAFLTTAWRHEVLQIRTSIFLIVDPAAFSERTKETINKKLVGLKKTNAYRNPDVCVLINLGQILLDFLTTYRAEEPEAVAQYNSLEPLLADLCKVLKECKTVSNLLSIMPKDFLYEVPKISQIGKTVSYEQLLKRLKLLFTIVSRINDLFHITDAQGGSIFESVECDTTRNTRPDNLTHTIGLVSMREKPSSIKLFGRHYNYSKNMFAREVSVNKSNQTNCIISKIHKHINGKRRQGELSFSVQLDDLFNDISQYAKDKNDKTNTIGESEDKAKSFVYNKNLSKVQNASILYDIPIGSNRQSLRKDVLKKKYRHLTENSLKEPHISSKVNTQVDIESDTSKAVMDSTTNLQITEILDQLSNFSKLIDLPTEVNRTIVVNVKTDSACVVSERPKDPNVLTLSVNGNMVSDQVETVKTVWNIPVNASNLDDSRPSEVSVGSSTQSNITTLERLSDIYLLEDKLNHLKSSNV